MCPLRHATRMENKTSTARVRCTATRSRTQEPAVQRLLVQISPSGCGCDIAPTICYLRDGIIGEECGMIELFLGPITWDELVPDARKNLFGNRKIMASHDYDVV